MNLIEDGEALAANAVIPGSGVLVKVGGFFARHGPGILMAWLVVGLLGLLYWAPWAVSRGAHSRDLEVAGLQKTIADMKAADAKATAEAATKARAAETAQNAVKEGSDHEIDDLRTRALALAATRLAQLRGAPSQAAATAGVVGGQGGGVSPAAGLPATAGRVSVVDGDDLRICTENTVKALGILPWWTKNAAIPR
jgi:hypothetical protein